MKDNESDERQRQQVSAARQRAASREQAQAGDRDLIQQFSEWKEAEAERKKVPQHRNKYDRYR